MTKAVTIDSKASVSFLLLAITFLLSCSPYRQVAKSARGNVLESEALKTAHVGISVFEPATGRYWYNHQADKYFVPASNAKIPTCYAAMKYLGDSLPGLRYQIVGDQVLAEPTGDPTFLQPEFRRQPVLAFLQGTDKKLVLTIDNWKDEPWGNGWSWNDYSESYMAERSAFPIYGNVVRFSNTLQSLRTTPQYFIANTSRDSAQDWSLYPSQVNRALAENRFWVEGRAQKERSVETPFYTANSTLIYSLLSDTLQKEVAKTTGTLSSNGVQVIYSQPTDSLLRPTMYRSDNFYAEQALLMVSNKVLRVMNDARIIDTLLKTDFKDLAQRPRWVDGSGLSRYNLFTPQNFITILDKMQRDFGMERIKNIFPTGGDGTLSSYFKADSTFLYAKTGTLSGIVALSGYMYTKKNKLLLFSVLVNNHQASSTAVRRAVEKFLQGIRNQY